MHQTSIDHMKDFFNFYVKRGSSVLDVGARKVGTQEAAFRTLAQSFGCFYTGMDIVKGQNVDLVCENPYKWDIKTGSYDVVISGSTFEHIDLFWMVFREMVKITKPGGVLCIIAPSTGPMHSFPVDCWRFTSGSMHALAKWGDVKLIDTTIDVDTKWNDCVGIFRKEK